MDALREKMLRGCAMSGLTADARTLVDHARVEAQVYLKVKRDQKGQTVKRIKDISKTSNFYGLALAVSDADS